MWNVITGGEILSKAELLVLKTSLSEDVIDKFREKGFSINEDDSSMTFEQIQYLLNMVGEASVASTLREKVSLNIKKVSIIFKSNND